jgi:V8-like Glu-specific endopeptidase
MKEGSPAEPGSAGARLRSQRAPEQPVAELTGSFGTDEIRALERAWPAVVLIERTGVGWGTGFMVTPDLLLTARHVADDLQGARDDAVKFHFGHERKEDSSYTGSEVLDKWRIVFAGKAEGEDYALIELSQIHDKPALVRAVRGAIGKLLLDPAKPVPGEPVAVIHHPYGHAKQNSMGAYTVEAVTEIGFLHTAYSVPGVSGAPVIAVSGFKVIGVHGGRLHRFSDPTGPTGYTEVKEAVSIARFLEDLKNRDPPYYQRILAGPDSADTCDLPRRRTELGERIDLYHDDSTESGSRKTVDSTGVHHLLKDRILKEVSTSINDQFVLRKDTYRETLNSIRHLSFFDGIGLDHLVCKQEIDSLNAKGKRYPIELDARILRRLSRLPEITISVPATMVGAITLLDFFKMRYNLNLTIRYKNCSGRDVLEDARNRRSSAAILPVSASAIAILSNGCEFRPVTLMPRGSFAIVSAAFQSKRKESNSKLKQIAMPLGDYSSSLMYCNELKEKGGLDRSISYTGIEYDEAASSLQDMDSSSGVAQWFPNYCFSELLYGGTPVVINRPAERSGFGSLSTFLFVRNDWCDSGFDINDLLLGLRESWVGLIENPSEWESIALKRFVNAEYVNLLKRCAGIAGCIPSK